MSNLIPTHAGQHILKGLSEYLATSFSLAEQATANSLKAFLTDPEAGMFHGPFVRTRLPYAPAADWEGSLPWLPAGFMPYRHQAEAFQRLASTANGQPRRPQPTLVVTGTGSGKTESFLYPILNHCLAHPAHGIQALILYPMNALANDQAARLAQLITTDRRLAGIRAGLYTGEASKTPRQAVSAEGLITCRETLRTAPPQILLTNYKMLDQLLLRDADHPLWDASATTLQYVVLDEFHTYDGAQGTDVALLLRRMGMKLKGLQPADFLSPEEAARPLGRITPVATSATLGDGGESTAEMLHFAHTIFGEQLSPDAVVRETTLTYEQWQRMLSSFVSSLPASERAAGTAGTDPGGPGASTGDGIGASTGDGTGEPSTGTASLVELVDSVNGAVHEATASTGGDGAGHTDFALAVHRVLCARLFRCPPEDLHAAVLAAAHHDLIRRVLVNTTRPIPLSPTDPAGTPSGEGAVGPGVATAAAGTGAGGEGAEPALTTAVFAPEELRQLGDGAQEFLAHLLSELAYLRSEFGKRHGWHGKKFPGVEAHLWVREVSRIDRAVEPDSTGTGMFRWSDNGAVTGNWLPACYCRNCGRSGWMAAIQPGGETLETSPQRIRSQALRQPAYQRPLIDATSETRAHRSRDDDTGAVLQWLDFPNAVLTSTAPSEAEQDHGAIVPVLTYAGENTEDLAAKDTCPSCGEPDAIRYLGSSVATLLSVAVSNLFGMDDLASEEKKSLVFVDSVQDAAHRAGFMQSRARTFAFRTRTAAAVGHTLAQEEKQLGLPPGAHRADLHRADLHRVDEGAPDRAGEPAPATLPGRGGAASSVRLDELPQLLLDRAMDDRARFELLPPWVAENERFQPFWDATARRADRRRARERLEKVLALEIALEFGDRADLARSLVSTGTLSVGVGAAEDELRNIAADAVAAAGGLELGDAHRQLAWARGVLEYMRLSGGIYTELLKGFIASDGNSYLLNRREAGRDGIPKFPRGGAPHFPRKGKPLHKKGYDDSTLPVTARRGWFAVWTAKQLGISAAQATHCCEHLFDLLAERGIVQAVPTKSGATMYALPPSRVVVAPEAEHQILECGVCHRRFGVNAHGRAVLAGTPCHSLGCEGTFQQVRNADNYYRRLYSSQDVRTVISREHTSLLPVQTRLEVENQFKARGEDQAPNGPNVLVATPTLEMGIDIGDLSTVMLASLPDSVASYVQRVGRAGRLSGNSLVVAVIRGRGKALARLERPLETIAGSVQAPAAYLSAREILHRQFIAYLLDTMHLGAAGVQGTVARHVFDPKSGVCVIDALARRVEGADGAGGLESTAPGRHPEAADTPGERGWRGLADALGNFVAAMGPFADPAVVEELHTWAAEGLVPHLRQKQREWLDGRMLLRQRKRALLEARMDLESQAASGAADDELIQRVRSTRAALRHISAQLDQQYDNEPWISALERCGLLPNFTLLDESVEFHVSISHSTTEGEFETETREYSRGVATGLFELAPGATFYVQGIAATIDSVELGPEGSGVQQWRLCPACSYSEIEHPGAVARSCPRCHAKGFGDSNQVLNVVEMTKVYSSVDFARSSITDSVDDRTSRRFEGAVSMVVPPGGYGPGWYLENTGFGVQYLPTVELRWLNLGAAVGGKREPLCGNEVEAPLFRVCRECGHLDSRAGTNDWRDHKPWCSRRNALEEDALLFALGRRLHTQGVLMHLPREISAADENATPSLIAALRMGFKLALGGNPNHLDVTSVFDSGAKGVSQKLLLHDSIPGGTGYLAQFTSPSDIRVLLEKVYEQLQACRCRNDQRSACPDCLLPFTFDGDAERTSRESAVSALTKILADDPHPDADATVVLGSSGTGGGSAAGGDVGGSASGGSATGGTDAPSGAAAEGTGTDAGAATGAAASSGLSEWDGHITEEEPQPDLRSQLEVQFLEALRADLRQAEAAVTERADGNNAKWTIQFPNSKVRWTMEEQKDFGFTRPDFYFTSDGPAPNQIAVYLDGAQFHASATHNSVASDMAKRRQLARNGILPWSMTMRDLHVHAGAVRGLSPEPPEWFLPVLRDRLNDLLQLDGQLHDKLLKDPMEQLVRILARPEPQLRLLGLAAMYHAQTYAGIKKQPYTSAGPSTATDRGSAPAGNAPASAPQSHSRAPRTAGGQVVRANALSAGIDFVNLGSVPHLTLIVEDGEPDQQEWNTFLSLGNLLFLAHSDAEVDVREVEPQGAAPQGVASPAAAAPHTPAVDRAASQTAPQAAPQVPDGSAHPAGGSSAPQLSPGWQQAIEEWGEDSGVAYEALLYLAQHEVPPPTDIGEELAGALTVAHWALPAGLDVALVEDLQSFDLANLGSHWVIFDAPSLDGAGEAWIPEALKGTAAKAAGPDGAHGTGNSGGTDSPGASGGRTPHQIDG